MPNRQITGLDLRKYGQLVAFVEALRPSTYVEFFSGDSQYFGEGNNICPGSSLRVLEAVKHAGFDCRAVLHEPDDGEAWCLRTNVSAFRNVQVRGAWQHSLDDYLSNADGSWLFFVDPPRVFDYRQLFEPINGLLGKGASMFFYIPVSPMFSMDSEVCNMLTEIIAYNSRGSFCKDDVFGVGPLKQVEWSAFVASPDALKRLSLPV